MKAHDHRTQDLSDPLGLSELDAIEPGYDDWAQIESALRAHHASQRGRQRLRTWMAIAAVLVLVISVTLLNEEYNAPVSQPAKGLATSADNSASVTMQD
ncbi:MAG: hypothetical protein WBS20_15135, partial [Lysobacterales bacterium]